MPVPVRVVVAGADGAAALAHTLRDAGMEVVLAGAGCRADQLVAIVVQEDADALAIAVPDEPSRETTDDATDAPAAIAALLGGRGIDDVPVLGCRPADLATIAGRLARHAAEA